MDLAAQVVPGYALSGNETFASVCYSGHVYLAYVSGSCVVIMTDTMATLQLLECRVPRSDAPSSGPSSKSVVNSLLTVSGGPFGSPAITSHRQRQPLLSPSPSLSAIGSSSAESDGGAAGEDDTNPTPPPPPSAIAWNSTSGLLAVAVASQVLIYAPSEAPVSSSRRCVWTQRYVLEAGFAVLSLAWSEMDDVLLVCGSRLTLWTVDRVERKFDLRRRRRNKGPSEEDFVWGAKKLWETNSTTDVYFSAISPDSRFLCTAGKYDKLPKVWRLHRRTKKDSKEDSKDKKKDKKKFSERRVKGESDEILEYRFSYLPHPRSVTSLQWRNGRRPTSDGSSGNILLTNCRDFSARLWHESGPSGCFSTCAVIKGARDHVFTWLTYHSFLHVSAETNSSRPCGIRGAPGQSDAGDEEGLIGAGRCAHQGLQRCCTRPLDHTAHDEWLLEVKGSTKVSFWRISGLMDTPLQCLPETNLWLSTKVRSYSAFPNPVQAFAICREVADGDEEGPRRLQMFLTNAHGGLCSWQFQITESAEMKMRQATSTCIRIRGHSGPVCQITSHSSLPYSASVDLWGDVLLWHCSSTVVADPSPIVRPICHDCVLPPTGVVTWAPNVPMLLAAPLHGGSTIGSAPVAPISAYYVASDAEHARATFSPSCTLQHVALEFEGSPVDTIAITRMMFLSAPPSKMGGLGALEDDIDYHLLVLDDGCCRVELWRVRFTANDQYDKNIEREEMEAAMVGSLSGSVPSGSVFPLSQRSSASAQWKMKCAVMVRKDVQPDQKISTWHRMHLCQGSGDSVLGNLLTGDSSGRVHVWSMAIGSSGSYQIELKQTIQCHDSPVLSIKSADCARFASIAEECRIQEKQKGDTSAGSRARALLERTQKGLSRASIHRRTPSTSSSISSSSLMRSSTTSALMSLSQDTTMPVETVFELKLWECETRAEYSLEHTITFARQEGDNASSEAVLEWARSEAGRVGHKIQHEKEEQWVQAHRRPVFVFKPYPGGHLLTVAHGGTITHYSQQHDPDGVFEFGSKWDVAGTLPKGTHLFPPATMSWTSAHCLLVGAGQAIFVHTRWGVDTINGSAQGSAQKTMVAPDSKSQIYHLFQFACSLQRPLPSYHPKQLMQYLIAGRFELVASILAKVEEWLKAHESLADRPHMCTVDPELPLEELFSQNVLKHVQDEHDDDVDVAPSESPREGAETSQQDDDSGQLDLGGFGLGMASARSPFASAAPSPFGAAAGGGFGGAASALFGGGAPSMLGGGGSTGGAAAALFDSPEEPDSAAAESLAVTGTVADDGIGASKMVDDFGVGFSSESAQAVSQLLSTTALPGVSSRAQVRLMAILDTWRQMKHLRGGLDECAVRFLLSFKMSEFVRRVTKKDAPLSSSDFAWALHSDSQDALLAVCLPEMCPWEDVQRLGVPLWCRNPTTIRRLAEAVAKVQFKAQQNPEDCALLYLALGKRSALMALFKAVRNKKLAEFLLNDFTKERWQTAAQKNAFALLGKQRFSLAAAFFLLGGDLHSAISVVMKHLKDWQLALFVARLVEGDDGKESANVLREHVLPIAEGEAEGPDGSKASDEWMCSAVLWVLKEHMRALTALTPPEIAPPEEDQSPSDVASALSPFGANVPLARPAEPATSKEARPSLAPAGQASSMSPSVVHFYEFLSSRPIVKRTLATCTDDESMEYRAGRVRLHRSAMAMFLRSGCPELALEQYLAHREESRMLQEDERKQRKKKKEQESQEVSNPFGFGAGLGGMLVMAAPAPAPAADEEDEDDGVGALDCAARSLQQTLSNKIALYILIRELANQNRLDQTYFRSTVDLINHLEPSVDTLLLHRQLESYCNHQQLLVQRLSLESSELLDHALTKKGDVVSPRNLEAPTAGSLPEWVVSDRAYALMEMANELESFAPYLPRTRFSDAQAHSLANRARNLHDCVVYFEETQSQLPQEARETMLLTVRLSLCIVAWVGRDYATLGGLLSSDLTFPFPAELLERIDELQSVDQTLAHQQRMADAGFGKTKPAERFVLRLFRVLLLREFLVLSENAGNTLWSTPLALWHSEVKAVLSNTPLLQISDGRTSTEFEEEQEAVAEAVAKLRTTQPERLLAALFKMSSFYEDSAGMKLWNNLSGHCEEFMSTRFLMKRMEAFTSSEPAARQWRPPVMLYRDSNVIQSFCINPGDSNHFVVATNKGLVEIHRDESAARSALRSSRSQPSVVRTSTGSPLSATNAPSRTIQSARKEKWAKKGSLSALNTLWGSTSPPTHSRQGSRGRGASPKSENVRTDHSRVAASWVESHPSQPYYISGGMDGAVHLWLMNHEESVATYRQPGNARVSKVHFNTSGSKFGFCDHSGYLSLYRFSTSVNLQRPYLALPCHDKRTLDFEFLNAGSFIATGGWSKEQRNLCFWDLLMPPHKALVASFQVHEDGGSFAVVYSPRHQLLMSGGKNGEIVVVDVRQRKVLETYRAHEDCVKTFALHPNERFMVSGATDGTAKLWELPAMRQTATWEDMHPRSKFGRAEDMLGGITTHGVLKASFGKDGSLFSCGSLSSEGGLLIHESYC